MTVRAQGLDDRKINVRGRNMKHGNDPVVSILEEVEDQGAATGAGWVETIISPLACGVSYLGGDKGRLCTLTVECQKSC